MIGLEYASTPFDIAECFNDDDVFSSAVVYALNKAGNLSLKMNYLSREDLIASRVYGSPKSLGGVLLSSGSTVEKTTETTASVNFEPVEDFKPLSVISVKNINEVSNSVMFTRKLNTFSDVKSSIVVTFDGNEGTPSYNSDEFTYGEQYRKLPTATREGYTFIGWYTSLSGGTLVTIYSTALTSKLYAHWVAHTLTVNFDANDGIVSPTSKTVVFDSTYGDLPIPTREGYTFNGWYTDIEDGIIVTSDTEVTTDYSHSLYAQWTAVV